MQLFEKTKKRRNRPRKHADGPGRGLEGDHGLLLGDDGEGGGGEGEGPEDGERPDEGVGHHPVRRGRRAIASQWERGVACQNKLVQTGFFLRPGGGSCRDPPRGESGVPPLGGGGPGGPKKIGVKKIHPQKKRTQQYNFPAFGRTQIGRGVPGGPN